MENNLADDEDLVLNLQSQSLGENPIIDIFSVKNDSVESSNGFEPGHFLYKASSVEDIAMGLNQE